MIIDYPVWQHIVMNNFEMPFHFQGHRYLARVSVTRGQDHLQYTVSPQDEDLLLQYGAQVIHEFSGRPLEAAFPGISEEQRAYSEAVLAGLHRWLNTAR
jgi:hypothetical protein